MQSKITPKTVSIYYVYALWSEKFDKIYVGFSEAPDTRLKAHNSGKSRSTKPYRPWFRFYLENFETRSIALKREKYLKSGWGRRILKKELEKWQSGRMHWS